MTRRAVGVVLLASAAGTAVVATFLPLSRIGADLGGDRFGYTTTSWATVSEPADLTGLGGAAQFGVPIVIAAVLLAVAGALVFLPEHQRVAARYTAVAATGLLAGSVWTTIMAVAAVLTPPPQESPVQAGLGIEYDTGPGLWLLVVSVLIAVLGTVLVHGRPAPPAEHDPDSHPDTDTDTDTDPDADTDTPPYGIQVAVLPELPDGRKP